MKPRLSDYSSVTELAGTMVSREAIDMVLTRYAFAADHCDGKAVLEVACGPGPGLGLLAARAHRLVAGDYTATVLRQARAHYGERVPLVRLDAGDLPFRPASFDVVLLFEAVYFLPDVDAFLASCRRVLSPGGRVLLVTVNPDWDAFHPNPHASKYWSTEELERLFRARGFTPDFYAGFPSDDGGLRGRVMKAAKQAAVALHLIPSTMKGKELLKRVAFGRLDPFPAEVTVATGTVRPPVRLTDLQATQGFKVLYAVARKDDTKHG